MKPSRSLRKKAFDSCRARNILCALPVDFDCAGENARWGEMVEVFHGKSEIESRPQGWRQSEEEFIETWRPHGVGPFENWCEAQERSRRAQNGAESQRPKNRSQSERP
jgi:hypothetical protein